LFTVVGIIPDDPYFRNTTVGTQLQKVVLKGASGIVDVMYPYTVLMDPKYVESQNSQKIKVRSVKYQDNNVGYLTRYAVVSTGG
jgi:hypothetical protein